MASSTQSARLPPWFLSWPFLLLLISTLQLRVVEADVSSRISSTPSPAKSAPSQVYTVKVGLADHKFEPDVIIAGVGDIVEFHFYPANHSVVRAEFDRPCVPYEMTGSGKTGFFSDFHPVDSVLDNPPSYSVKINDTSPVFFYCSAPGSCIDYGMVGAINPNASTSIGYQRQRARDSAYMLNPGESFPPESPISSATPGPSSTPSSYAPASKPSTGKKNHNVSAGAIAGIVVATIGVIFLGALVFLMRHHNRALKQNHRHSTEQASDPTPAWQPRPPFSSPQPPLSSWAPLFSPSGTPQELPADGVPPPVKV